MAAQAASSQAPTTTTPPTPTVMGPTRDAPSAAELYATFQRTAGLVGELYRQTTPNETNGLDAQGARIREAYAVALTTAREGFERFQAQLDREARERAQAETVAQAKPDFAAITTARDRILANLGNLQYGQAGARIGHNAPAHLEDITGWTNRALETAGNDPALVREASQTTNTLYQERRQEPWVYANPQLHALSQQIVEHIDAFKKLGSAMLTEVQAQVTEADLNDPAAFEAAVQRMVRDRTYATPAGSYGKSPEQLARETLERNRAILSGQPARPPQGNPAPAPAPFTENPFESPEQAAAVARIRAEMAARFQASLQQDPTNRYARLVVDSATSDAELKRLQAKQQHQREEEQQQAEAQFRETLTGRTVARLQEEAGRITPADQEFLASFVGDRPAMDQIRSSGYDYFKQIAERIRTAPETPLIRTLRDVNPVLFAPDAAQNLVLQHQELVHNIVTSIPDHAPVLHRDEERQDPVRQELHRLVRQEEEGYAKLTARLRDLQVQRELGAKIAQQRELRTKKDTAWIALNQETTQAVEVRLREKRKHGEPVYAPDYQFTAADIAKEQKALSRMANPGTYNREVAKEQQQWLAVYRDAEGKIEQVLSHTNARPPLAPPSYQEIPADQVAAHETAARLALAEAGVRERALQTDILQAQDEAQNRRIALYHRNERGLRFAARMDRQDPLFQAMLAAAQGQEARSNGTAQQTDAGRDGEDATRPPTSATRSTPPVNAVSQILQERENQAAFLEGRQPRAIAREETVLALRERLPWLAALNHPDSAMGRLIQQETGRTGAINPDRLSAYLDEQPQLAAISAWEERAIKAAFEHHARAADVPARIRRGPGESREQHYARLQRLWEDGKLRTRGAISTYMLANPHQIDNVNLGPDHAPLPRAISHALTMAGIAARTFQPEQWGTDQGKQIAEQTEVFDRILFNRGYGKPLPTGQHRQAVLKRWYRMQGWTADQVTTYEDARKALRNYQVYEHQAGPAYRDANGQTRPADILGQPLLEKYYRQVAGQYLRNQAVLDVASGYNPFDTLESYHLVAREARETLNSGRFVDFHTGKEVPYRGIARSIYDQVRQQLPTFDRQIGYQQVQDLAAQFLAKALAETELTARRLGHPGLVPATRDTFRSYYAELGKLLVYDLPVDRDQSEKDTEATDDFRKGRTADDEDFEEGGSTGVRQGVAAMSQAARQYTGVNAQLARMIENPSTMLSHISPVPQEDGTVTALTMREYQKAVADQLGLITRVSFGGEAAAYRGAGHQEYDEQHTLFAGEEPFAPHYAKVAEEGVGKWDAHSGTLKRAGANSLQEDRREKPEGMGHYEQNALKHLYGHTLAILADPSLMNGWPKQQQALAKRLGILAARDLREGNSPFHQGGNPRLLTEYLGSLVRGGRDAVTRTALRFYAQDHGTDTGLFSAGSQGLELPYVHGISSDPDAGYLKAVQEVVTDSRIGSRYTGASQRNKLTWFQLVKDAPEIMGNHGMGRWLALAGHLKYGTRLQWERALPDNDMVERNPRNDVADLFFDPGHAFAGRAKDIAGITGQSLLDWSLIPFRPAIGGLAQSVSARYGTAPGRYDAQADDMALGYATVAAALGFGNEFYDDRLTSQQITNRAEAERRLLDGKLKDIARLHSLEEADAVANRLTTIGAGMRATGSVPLVDILGDPSSGRTGFLQDLWGLDEELVRTPGTARVAHMFRRLEDGTEQLITPQVWATMDWAQRDRHIIDITGQNANASFAIFPGQADIHWSQVGALRYAAAHAKELTDGSVGIGARFGHEVGAYDTEKEALAPKTPIQLFKVFKDRGRNLGHEQQLGGAWFGIGQAATLTAVNAATGKENLEKYALLPGESANVRRFITTGRYDLALFDANGRPLLGRELPFPAAAFGQPVTTGAEHYTEWQQAVTEARLADPALSQDPNATATANGLVYAARKRNKLRGEAVKPLGLSPEEAAAYATARALIGIEIDKARGHWRTAKGNKEQTEQWRSEGQRLVELRDRLDREAYMYYQPRQRRQAGLPPGKSTASDYFREDREQDNVRGMDDATLEAEWQKERSEFLGVNMRQLSRTVRSWTTPEGLAVTPSQYRVIGFPLPTVAEVTGARPQEPGDQEQKLQQLQEIDNKINQYSQGDDAPTVLGLTNLSHHTHNAAAIRRDLIDTLMRQREKLRRQLAGPKVENQTEREKLIRERGKLMAERDTVLELRRNWPGNPPEMDRARFATAMDYADRFDRHRTNLSAKEARQLTTIVMRGRWEAERQHMAYLDWEAQSHKIRREDYLTPSEAEARLSIIRAQDAKLRDKLRFDLHNPPPEGGANQAAALVPAAKGQTGATRTEAVAQATQDLVHGGHMVGGYRVNLPHEPVSWTTDPHLRQFVAGRLKLGSKHELTIMRKYRDDAGRVLREEPETYRTPMHLYAAMRFGPTPAGMQAIQQVREQAKPEDARRMALMLKGVRPGWEHQRIAALETVVGLRMNQTGPQGQLTPNAKRFRTELLQTGDKLLIEPERPDRGNAEFGANLVGDRYVGSNLYGQVLMQARDRLRQEGGPGQPGPSLRSMLPWIALGAGAGLSLLGLPHVGLPLMAGVFGRFGLPSLPPGDSNQTQRNQPQGPLDTTFLPPVEDHQANQLQYFRNLHQGILQQHEADFYTARTGLGPNGEHLPEFHIDRYNRAAHELNKRIGSTAAHLWDYRTNGTRAPTGQDRQPAIFARHPHEVNWATLLPEGTVPTAHTYGWQSEHGGVHAWDVIMPQGGPLFPTAGHELWRHNQYLIRGLAGVTGRGFREDRLRLIQDWNQRLMALDLHQADPLGQTNERIADQWIQPRADGSLALRPAYGTHGTWDDTTPPPQVRSTFDNQAYYNQVMQPIFLANLQQAATHPLTPGSAVAGPHAIDRRDSFTLAAADPAADMRGLAAVMRHSLREDQLRWVKDRAQRSMGIDLHGGDPFTGAVHIPYGQRPRWLELGAERTTPLGRGTLDFQEAYNRHNIPNYGTAPLGWPAVAGSPVAPAAIDRTGSVAWEQARIPHGTPAQPARRRMPAWVRWLMPFSTIAMAAPGGMPDGVHDFMRAMRGNHGNLPPTPPPTGQETIGDGFHQPEESKQADGHGNRPPPRPPTGLTPDDFEFFGFGQPAGHGAHAPHVSAELKNGAGDPDRFGNDQHAPGRARIDTRTQAFRDMRETLDVDAEYAIPKDRFHNARYRQRIAAAVGRYREGLQHKPIGLHGQPIPVDRPPRWFLRQAETRFYQPDMWSQTGVTQQDRFGNDQHAPGQLQLVPAQQQQVAAGTAPASGGADQGQDDEAALNAWADELHARQRRQQRRAAFQLQPPATTHQRLRLAQEKRGLIAEEANWRMWRNLGPASKTMGFFAISRALRTSAAAAGVTQGEAGEFFQNATYVAHAAAMLGGSPHYNPLQLSPASNAGRAAMTMQGVSEQIQAMDKEDLERRSQAKRDRDASLYTEYELSDKPHLTLPPPAAFVQQNLPGFEFQEYHLAADVRQNPYVRASDWEPQVGNGLGADIMAAARQHRIHQQATQDKAAIDQHNRILATLDPMSPEGGAYARASAAEASRNGLRIWGMDRPQNAPERPSMGTDPVAVPLPLGAALDYDGEVNLNRFKAPGSVTLETFEKGMAELRRPLTPEELAKAEAMVKASRGERDMVQLANAAANAVSNFRARYPELPDRRNVPPHLRAEALADELVHYTSDWSLYGGQDHQALGPNASYTIQSTMFPADAWARTLARITGTPGMADGWNNGGAELNFQEGAALFPEAVAHVRRQAMRVHNAAGISPDRQQAVFDKYLPGMTPISLPGNREHELRHTFTLPQAQGHGARWSTETAGRLTGDGLRMTLLQDRPMLLATGRKEPYYDSPFNHPSTNNPLRLTRRPAPPRLQAAGATEPPAQVMVGHEREARRIFATYRPPAAEPRHLQHESYYRRGQQPPFGARLLVYPNRRGPGPETFWQGMKRSYQEGRQVQLNPRLKQGLDDLRHLPGDQLHASRSVLGDHSSPHVAAAKRQLTGMALAGVIGASAHQDTLLGMLMPIALTDVGGGTDNPPALYATAIKQLYTSATEVLTARRSKNPGAIELAEAEFGRFYHQAAAIALQHGSTTNQHDAIRDRLEQDGHVSYAPRAGNTVNSAAIQERVAQAAQAATVATAARDTERYRISPSQLKKFLDPRDPNHQAWLDEYAYGNPPGPTHPAAQLGTIFHAIVDADAKAYHATGAYLSERDLYQLMEDTGGHYGLPGDELVRGQDFLEHYAKQLRPGMEFSQLQTEARINVPFTEHTQMTGQADQVWTRPDGSIEIGDYKTVSKHWDQLSGPEVEAARAEYHRQAEGYHLQFPSAQRAVFKRLELPYRSKDVTEHTETIDLSPASLAAFKTGDAAQAAEQMAAMIAVAGGDRRPPRQPLVLQGAIAQRLGIDTGAAGGPAADGASLTPADRREIVATAMNRFAAAKGRPFLAPLTGAGLSDTRFNDWSQLPALQPHIAQAEAELRLRLKTGARYDAWGQGSLGWSPKQIRMRYGQAARELEPLQRTPLQHEPGLLLPPEGWDDNTIGFKYSMLQRHLGRDTYAKNALTLMLSGVTGEHDFHSVRASPGSGKTELEVLASLGFLAMHPGTKAWSISPTRPARDANARRFKERAAEIQQVAPSFRTGGRYQALTTAQVANRIILAKAPEHEAQAAYLWTQMLPDYGHSSVPDVLDSIQSMDTGELEDTGTFKESRAVLQRAFAALLGQQADDEYYKGFKEPATLEGYLTRFGQIYANPDEARRLRKNGGLRLTELQQRHNSGGESPSKAELGLQHPDLAFALFERQLAQEGKTTWDQSRSILAEAMTHGTARVRSTIDSIADPPAMIAVDEAQRLSHADAQIVAYLQALSRRRAGTTLHAAVGDEGQQVGSTLVGRPEIENFHQYAGRFTEHGETPQDQQAHDLNYNWRSGYGLVAFRNNLEVDPRRQGRRSRQLYARPLDLAGMGPREFARFHMVGTDYEAMQAMALNALRQAGIPLSLAQQLSAIQDHKERRQAMRTELGPLQANGIRIHDRAGVMLPKVQQVKMFGQVVKDMGIHALFGKPAYVGPPGAKPGEEEYEAGLNDFLNTIGASTDMRFGGVGVAGSSLLANGMMFTKGENEEENAASEETNENIGFSRNEGVNGPEDIWIARRELRHKEQGNAGVFKKFLPGNRVQYRRHPQDAWGAPQPLHDRQRDQWFNTGRNGNRLLSAAIRSVADMYAHGAYVNAWKDAHGGADDRRFNQTDSATPWANLPEEYKAYLRDLQPADLRRIADQAAQVRGGDFGHFLTDPTATEGRELAGVQRVTVNDYATAEGGVPLAQHELLGMVQPDVATHQRTVADQTYAFLRQVAGSQPRPRATHPVAALIDAIMREQGVTHQTLAAAEKLADLPAASVQGLVASVQEGVPQITSTRAKEAGMALKDWSNVVETLMLLPHEVLGQDLRARVDALARQAKDQRLNQVTNAAGTGMNNWQGPAAGANEDTGEADSGGRKPPAPPKAPGQAGGGGRRAPSLAQTMLQQARNLGRFGFDMSFAANDLLTEGEQQAKESQDFYVAAALANPYGVPGTAKTDGATFRDSAWYQQFRNSQGGGLAPGMSMTQALEATTATGAYAGTTAAPDVALYSGVAKALGETIDQFLQTGVPAALYGGKPGDVNGNLKNLLFGPNSSGGLYSVYGAEGTGQALGAVAAMDFGTQSQKAGFLIQSGQAFGNSPAALADQAAMYNDLAQSLQSPNLTQALVLAQTEHPELAGNANALLGSITTPDTLRAQAGLQRLGVDMSRLGLENQLGMGQKQYNVDSAQLGVDTEQQWQAGEELNQQQLDYQHYVAMQNAQYGAIGADHSRNAYYDYERSQAAAHHDAYTSEHAGDQVQQPTFGLANEEFYAGMEHQRTSMILGRSSLFSDQAFKENLSYINKQEEYYQKDLDLRNQDRQFTQDKLLRQLDWAEKSYAVQTNLYNVTKDMKEAQAKVDARQDSWNQQLLDALNKDYLASSKEYTGDTGSGVDKSAWQVLLDMGKDLQQQGAGSDWWKTLQVNLTKAYGANDAQTIEAEAKYIAQHPELQGVSQAAAIKQLTKAGFDLTQVLDLLKGDQSVADQVAAGKTNADITTWSPDDIVKFVATITKVDQQFADMARSMGPINVLFGGLAEGLTKVIPIIIAVSGVLSLIADLAGIPGLAKLFTGGLNTDGAFLTKNLPKVGEALLGEAGVFPHIGTAIGGALGEGGALEGVGTLLMGAARGGGALTTLLGIPGVGEALAIGGTGLMFGHQISHGLNWLNDDKNPSHTLSTHIVNGNNPVGHELQLLHNTTGVGRAVGDGFSVLGTGVHGALNIASKAWDFMGDIGDKIGPVLQGIVGGIWKGLQAIGGALWDGIKGFATKVGDDFNKFLQGKLSLWDIFGQLLDGIKNIGGHIGDFWMANEPKVQKAIGDALGGAWNWLSTKGGPAIADAVGKAWNAITGWMSNGDNWKGLWNGVMGGIGRFGEFLLHFLAGDQVYHGIMDKIGGPIGKAFAALGGFVHDLFTGKLFGQIGDGIGKAMSGFGAGAHDLFVGKLLGGLGRHIDDLHKGIASAWDEHVAKPFGLMWTTLQLIFKGAQKWVGDLWVQYVVKPFDEAWFFFQKLIKDFQTNGIPGVIKDLTDAIGNLFDAGKQLLLNSPIGKFIQPIFDAIGGLFDFGKKLIKDFQQGGFAKVFADMTSALGNGLMGLVKGALEIFKGILEKGKDIPGIGGALGPLIDKAVAGVDAAENGLPKFALGGRPPTGHAILVGDGGGPEVFVPDVNGTVIGTQATANLLHPPTVHRENTLHVKISVDGKVAADGHLSAADTQTLTAQVIHAIADAVEGQIGQIIIS